MSSKITLALGSFGILFADLVTKYLVTQQLAERMEFSPLVIFELHRNPGIAFSIPLPRLTIIIGSILIMAGLVWLFVKQSKQNVLATTAFTLLLGGAAGNLVERIMLGSVTDFVSMLGIPFFNLADVGITTGVALLVLFQKKIFAVN